MKSKRQMALELARAAAKPGSRFYDQDVRDCFTHHMSRPIAAVRESYARMNVVSSVSLREISTHCQVSGLPGFRR